MDKIKNFVNIHSNKIHYIMVLGAFIASINTFARADFNFILYLYMFYIWILMEKEKESQAQEKLSFFYILIFSLFIDLIWCLYWGNKWGSIIDDQEKGIHNLVLTLSWIGIIVKIIIIFMVGVLEWNSIKSSLPKYLQEKLNGPYNEYIDEK